MPENYETALKISEVVGKYQLATTYENVITVAKKLKVSEVFVKVVWGFYTNNEEQFIRDLKLFGASLGVPPKFVEMEYNKIKISSSPYIKYIRLSGIIRGNVKGKYSVDGLTALINKITKTGVGNV